MYYNILKKLLNVLLYVGGVILNVLYFLEGAPKCMVHSVGGTLLKHLEEHIVQGNR